MRPRRVLARFYQKQRPGRKGPGVGLQQRDAAVGLHLFAEAGKVGGLDVQLVYFRGLNECRASSFVSGGRGLKELMSRIGHTTPAMAMRYQIAAQERDAAIADKLSELAAGKG